MSHIIKQAKMLQSHPSDYGTYLHTKKNLFVYSDLTCLHIETDFKSIPFIIYITSAVMWSKHRYLKYTMIFELARSWWRARFGNNCRCFSTFPQIHELQSISDICTTCLLRFKIQEESNFRIVGVPDQRKRLWHSLSPMSGSNFGIFAT